MLGLSIVFAFTGFFMLTDILFLKYIIFTKRARSFLGPRIERWISDGVFQLQRQAYEGDNQGVWLRQSKEVPTTTQPENLRDRSGTNLPKYAHTENSAEGLSETKQMTEEVTNVRSLTEDSQEGNGPVRHDQGGLFSRILGGQRTRDR